MVRARWTSAATAAALLLALIPLVLPGGLSLSLCLSTQRLQLHAPGTDACGDCDPSVVAEVATDSGCETQGCCSSNDDPEPADGGAPGLDRGLSSAPCECCVELAKTTRRPGTQLEARTTHNAQQCPATQPSWPAPATATAASAVTWGSRPPPDVPVAYVAPLLI